MKILEGYQSEISRLFWFIFGFGIILLILTGCATTGEIKVSDAKETIWFASFDSSYAFQGKFVSVLYTDTKTTGLKLEEPLGDGWKKLGVKEGDIWMGIADMVYLKPEDWRKVWVIVKSKIGARNTVAGILKHNSDGTYDKEITWLLLK